MRGKKGTAGVPRRAPEPPEDDVSEARVAAAMRAELEELKAARGRAAARHEAGAVRTVDDRVEELRRVAANPGEWRKYMADREAAARARAEVAEAAGAREAVVERRRARVPGAGFDFEEGPLELDATPDTGPAEAEELDDEELG